MKAPKKTIMEKTHNLMCKVYTDKGDQLELDYALRNNDKQFMLTYVERLIAHAKYLRDELETEL